MRAEPPQTRLVPLEKKTPGTAFPHPSEGRAGRWPLPDTERASASTLDFPGPLSRQHCEK